MCWVKRHRTNILTLYLFDRYNKALKGAADISIHSMYQTLNREKEGLLRTILRLLPKQD